MPQNEPSNLEPSSPQTQPSPDEGGDRLASLKATLHEKLGTLRDMIQTGKQEQAGGMPWEQMGPEDAALPENPPPPLPEATESDPATVKSATAALMEAGRLPAATDQITPEVTQAALEVANEASPGLYSETDIEEVLRDIANGIIPVARKQQPGAQQPLPGGGPGGQPVLGPGGGPGAGGGAPLV